MQVKEHGKNSGRNIMSGVDLIHTGESVMAINAPVLTSNDDGADSWIETFNHNFVHYTGQNDPKHFDIEDIAHSLAQLARFNGHCVEQYNVAQHSCLIAEFANDDLKLEALLHDAAEAYIGDIPRPVKNLFPDLKKLENWLQTQIFANFGLAFPYPRDIDILDSRLLLTEGNQLFKRKVHWRCGNLTPLDYKFTEVWEWKKAEEEFLKAFDKYWELKK
jgi:hypothetical protein